MTTANVTVTLVDASLDPVEGARVTAKLFFPESLIDFIAPESSEVTGTTDAAGQAVLAVWPNALNTTVQTYYKFRAWHPTTKAKILDVCAYVPNTASNLEDLAYECRGTTSGSTGAAESAALSAHINDPTDAHDASAISVLDAGGNFTGTDVESVLAELTGQGLQYFTEARSIASPNATVPAHSFTASGSEASIDAILSPKANGAVLGDIPDGATSGGNKRGTNAVDWQLSRFGATAVASGSYSVISGGRGNTVSGAYSFVGGGNSNVVSNAQSVCCGGQANTTSGSFAVVSGGYQNTASGDYSVIPGGYFATTRGLTGRMSFSAGPLLGTTVAQIGTHVLRAFTDSNVTTSLTSSDVSPVATNVSVIPDTSSYTVIAYIIARTDTGTTAAWKIEGAIKRGTGAATTALVGTPSVTEIAKDAGAAAWSIAMAADTTLGSIDIRATGEVGVSIAWLCNLSTVEMTY